jgi:hypothetical protein
MTGPVAATGRRRIGSRHVPDAVDYFDFLDPDGNKLSFYTEV